MLQHIWTMLRKLHLILALILAGCNNEPLEVDEKEFTKDLERPVEDLHINPKVTNKIDQLWYSKIDITISKNVPLLTILKSIANKLGLKLHFNIPETISIDYCAKNKPFLEILSDISDLQGWKMLINGVNGQFSKDSAYIFTYSVPYLVGSRKSSSDTSFSGNLESSDPSLKQKSASGANITTNSNLDAFDELGKNIEIMFPNKDGEDSVKFSLHRQGGVLVVHAKQSQHKMIAKFINVLSSKIHNQILIEARIYEIELFEKFETGIDWARVLTYGFASSGSPVSGTLSNGMFGLELNANAEAAMSSLKGNIAKFLREFGKVQSISNPRVLIGNNNTVIFKAVDNKVFFRLKQNVISTGSSDKKSENGILNQITSEIQTVPIGIIMLVQPSIDDYGNIMISLHSSITEVQSEVDDPAVLLMSSNEKVVSKIPIVKTRELDTVFTTEDGKVVIIGGLLYTKRRETEAGLPLGPAFAWFGGNKLRLSEKKEIVMVIQAKIKRYERNLDELIFLSK